MKEKTLKENFQSYGIKKVLNYLDSDPDANIPKIIDWVEKFDRNGDISSQYYYFRSRQKEKDKRTI